MRSLSESVAENGTDQIPTWRWERACVKCPRARIVTDFFAWIELASVPSDGIWRVLSLLSEPLASPFPINTFKYHINGSKYLWFYHLFISYIHHDFWKCLWFYHLHSVHIAWITRPQSLKGHKLSEATHYSEGDWTQVFPNKLPNWKLIQRRYFWIFDPQRERFKWTKDKRSPKTE